MIAGRLRAISWDYAFYTAAAAIVVMFFITVFFYKEPPREIEGKTVGENAHPGIHHLVAPKEKAGLYMGSNFLAVGVGSFSGLIYTPLYGRFADAGAPEKVWYVLAGHLIVGIVALLIFQRVAGGFVQQEK